MKITPLADAQRRARTVAVGTFDGVHLGHREVIAGADTVLTFDPHPMSVTSPKGAPLLLTTTERKVELLAGLGVEELIVVSFDAEFAARSADQFIDQVLVDGIGAEEVRVGGNFGFGHKAQGNPESLLADDRFKTTVVPLFELDGAPVSSNRIRQLIEAGDVVEAARLLGAPFLYSGNVQHGEKRGCELGYPTANINPRVGFCTPGSGVYTGRAELDDGSIYIAAINVGLRPMFESQLGLQVEAFLLDFDGDLYGRLLRVEFLERLRGEASFDSVDALVEQMAKDVEMARARVGL